MIIIIFLYTELLKHRPNIGRAALVSNSPTTNINVDTGSNLPLPAVLGTHTFVAGNTLIRPEARTRESLNWDAL